MPDGQDEENVEKTNDAALHPSENSNGTNVGVIACKPVALEEVVACVQQAAAVDSAPRQINSSESAELLQTSGAPAVEAPCTDGKKRCVTVMLKNIACRLTQEDVKEVLDDVGLGGKFDMVFMPRSIAGRSNLGYVFVNFTAAEYVDECRALLEGKPFGKTDTTKLCEISLARVQGIEGMGKLMKRKKNRPLFVGKDAEQCFLQDRSTPEKEHEAALADVEHPEEPDAGRKRKAKGEDKSNQTAVAKKQFVAQDSPACSYCGCTIAKSLGVVTCAVCRIGCISVYD